MNALLLALDTEIDRGYGDGGGRERRKKGDHLHSYSLLHCVSFHRYAVYSMYVVH